MFGYTLKLIKKKDIYEYGVFEKVVPSLRDQINQFSAWLHGEFTLNHDTIHQLAVDVEGLKAMINVYVKNKYSAPASSVMLVDGMNRIRQYASQITSIIQEAQNLSTIERMANSALQRGESFDDDEYNSCLEEAKQMIGEQITTSVTGIIMQLRLMIVNIEPDLVALTMGVDALRERDKLYRKTSKGNKYVSGLGVKFLSVPKEEILKHEKEHEENE